MGGRRGWGLMQRDGLLCSFGACFICQPAAQSCSLSNLTHRPTSIIGDTKPESSIKRNDGLLPKIQSLTLSGSPGVQVVAQNVKNSKRITNAMYVSQSALQFASVTVGTQLVAWVTDTRGAPPPPVAGATVTVFLASYGSGGVRGPSCKTAVDGTCSFDLKKMLKGRYVGSLSVLIEAAGQGTLLVNNIEIPYIAGDGNQPGPEKWSGALVLDRFLVQPDDKLHVTGECFCCWLALLCSTRYVCSRCVSSSHIYPL